MDSEDRVVFAAYHRHRDSAIALRVVGTTTALLVGGALLAFVVAAAPTAPSQVAATPPTKTSLVPGRTPAAAALVLPTPTPESTPIAEEAAAVVPPPPVEDSAWQVGVDASGYQSELDACLWVRMNLDAVAPIVGAHRTCGGSIVLDMALADAVRIDGEGLDGDYIVTDARDALAGDVAATATAGLVADVILQTCYPGADSRVRLVALRILPSSA